MTKEFDNNYEFITEAYIGYGSLAVFFSSLICMRVTSRCPHCGKMKQPFGNDVCLQPSGEVNIVVAKPFQNRHIGRRVINEIIKLAKEKNIQELHAEIYSFNTQSQKMFQSIGFKKVDNEQYVLSI